MSRLSHSLRLALALLLGLFCGRPALADLKTWDGKHSIDKIDVTIVYFLPRDRAPLADWKDRVSYFARRIEQFHAREYNGQSTLRTIVHPEPLRSARTTEQLRSGDGDFIFFQTLRETDEALRFGQDKTEGAFPILLVLSEVNWRPLDDFYRLRQEEGKLVFEGNLSGDRHFPGSGLGGARATYLSREGKGWGLVSADGWRVPYCGSDCVVYHEGVGHTVGLPHPEPGNGSVMSLAQYRGWISESWLDDDQKQRLGWTKPETPLDRERDLYSAFRALPEPHAPAPDEPVRLRLDWPKDAQVASLRVRIQTDVLCPWVDAPTDPAAPQSVSLGRFDRPTPVSYRVDAALQGGERVELWGYFQVRAERGQTPLPPVSRPLPEFARNTGASSTAATGSSPATGEPVDLLSRIDVARDTVQGQWTLEDGVLESPSAFGARIEIPYEPPAEYRMIAVVEPLDEPNALILGQRSGESRFLTLLNFGEKEKALSALENVDGKNVGANLTTVAGPLLHKGEPSQVIVTVRKTGVEVSVDGRRIIDWEGSPEALSLSDYWKTPNAKHLFVGAYACRYRISRLTLVPLND